MRILKRNLAFMLAMIMALSLTAFAGYEDYPDVDELTYVEAVDVLTELGIVEGSNGELLPTGNLTRAQAAKLIAYTMLGKKAADALQAEVAPFTDVPTYHWAAGYVEYCADQGIVGGMGDGTFVPEANVTASQFAKMLLCAVGYGEKGEFTGASWDSTVNSQATKLGVFDGNLDVVFAEAVTREEAFLYTFNALTKVMEVTYSADADEYYAGTVFNSIKGFDFDETLGAKLYDLNTKDGEDAFGREGYTWYKNNKKITGLYTYAPDAKYTAKVKSGTIYADLDLDKTTQATVIRNGKSVADMQLKKNLTSTTIGGNGVLVEAYLDEDMDVTLIVIDTYLAQVDDVTGDDVDFTVFMDNADDVSVVNHETDMDLTEDQYVLVTMVKNGTKYEIQSIKEVVEVTGELDAKGAGSTYTEMNGTKYSHSYNLDDATGSVVYVPSFDTDLIMMLDEYGYMIGLVKASTSENLDGYVLVTDSEVEVGGLASTDKALVEVMWLDGTGYEVLNLDTKRAKNDDGNRATFYKDHMGAWVEIEADAEGNDVIPYGFYAYTMTDEGEIVLKDLTKTSAKEIQALSGTITADGKTQNFDVTGMSVDLVLDNDSVLNMVTSDDLEVYEGYKNIKIAEDDVDVLVVYKNRTVTEIYVVDGHMLDDEIIAYYNGTELKVIDGDYYIMLYIDGEAGYYEYDESVVVNTLGASIALKQGAYAVEMEDGVLTEMALWKSEAHTEVVTTAKPKYFKVEGETDEIVYADGCNVYDLTDGVEVVNGVAKDDLVLYITKGDENANVVTNVWILEHNTSKEDVEEDTVAGDIVATWDGDNQWIRFAGLKEADTADLEIKVLQRVDGAYGYVTSLYPVWDSTNNWHAANATALDADNNVVFQLFLNGEQVAVSQVIITK